MTHPAGQQDMSGRDLELTPIVPEAEAEVEKMKPVAYLLEWEGWGKELSFEERPSGKPPLVQVTPLVPASLLTAKDAEIERVKQERDDLRVTLSDAHLDLESRDIRAEAAEAQLASLRTEADSYRKAMESDWQTLKAVGQVLQVRRLKLLDGRYHDVSDFDQALSDIRSCMAKNRAVLSPAQPKESGND